MPTTNSIFTSGSWDWIYGAYLSYNAVFHKYTVIVSSSSFLFDVPQPDNAVAIIATAKTAEIHLTLLFLFILFLPLPY